MNPASKGLITDLLAEYNIAVSIKCAGYLVFCQLKQERLCTKVRTELHEELDILLDRIHERVKNKS